MGGSGYEFNVEVQNIRIKEFLVNTIKVSCFVGNQLFLVCQSLKVCIISRKEYIQKKILDQV